MCPLWPLHILFLYILIVGPLLLMAHKIPATASSIPGLPKKLDVTFSSELSERLVEGQTKSFEFSVAHLEDLDSATLFEIELTNTNPEVAEIDEREMRFYITEGGFVPNTNWTGSFNLTARFLGYTKIAVKLWAQVSAPSGGQSVQLVGESEAGRVAVTRAQRPIDKAFVYTVAILIALAFVNMGCTLDLSIVKATLKRPIGPLIGFSCQYIFMPLVRPRMISIMSWLSIL